MAVDLLTNVILNGEIGAGFGKMAAALQNLGSTVDRIGGRVREFEKESVEVYRNYEDNMLGVRRVFSGQVDSATELSQIMENLNIYASEWAATTIFHTDDVSAAILKAAQSGFDYTEIINAIPQAMLIAQAGSMELTTGLDQLATIMRATGSDYGMLGTIVDEWAMAADSSKTSISEMGDAFTSLGAAAQFGDSTAELFTLLAVLANVGTTGTQAGTALRGAMMRLIAPTTKAENAMSLLGADADELNEVLADENVTKAAKQLEGLGFSAYDSQGNLLPMIDIFTNLHTALQGLDEASQNEILAAIFPTRTIAAAKAFMDAVGSGKMAELFGDISDSEGYAEKGADIMMSGLTGAIETLKSKWEEFQRSVGETLAPWIETVAGHLGSIMDAINGMDEATLSGLVGSLTALAELGPVMLGTGGIIKAVDVLGVKGTLLVGAVMAAGALVGYFSKLQEIDFESNFGKMEVDLDELGKHVDSLKTQFDAQQQAIATWEEALEAAEEKYAKKSSALAETMLMDVLTGKKLTDDEIRNINQYAQDLHDAVWKGLENAEASDMTFLDAIFGDHENLQQEEVANTAAQVVTHWYEKLYGEAEQVGEELRNQMTAALQDGTLNEAERQAIQASIDRYNQIMAEIQSAMDAEAYYEQLYKAQSVSWDSISGYMEENAQKKAADLQALEDAYAAKYAHYMAAYDNAIQNDDEYITIDGKKQKVSEEDRDAFVEQLEFEKQKARQDIIDKYGNLNSAAFDALMNDSDTANAWNFMKYMGKYGLGAEDFVVQGQSNMQALGITPEIAQDLANQLYELNRTDSVWAGFGKGKLSKLLEPFAESEGIGSYISMLSDSNLKNLAGALMDYAARYTAFEEEGTDEFNEFSTPESRALAEAQKHLVDLQEKQSEINAEIAEREERLNNPASRPLTYGLFNGELNDKSALYGTYSGGQYQGGGLYDEQAQVNLDIAAAESEIARLQGEVNALSTSETVSVVATLDSSAIDNYTPPTKRMTVTPYVVGGNYAEGGRAVTPSIFGEAGPEWAIPEEHSERTAELLNKAREASGFTWGDLIERYGGLNANPNNQNVTVNYSPTINAQDAQGVAEVLAADKARLLKLVRDMLAEQRFRDEVEVYA